MSKSLQRIDGKRMEFSFTFPRGANGFLGDKKGITEILEQTATGMAANEFEFSMAIAAGIKRAIDRSGYSREQVVDKINDFFGRSKADAHADTPTCRNPLSIHMLNNYLSKPQVNPIPAYYLFAIHRITKDLEPIRVMAESEGAQIATAEDIRHMALGRLEEHLAEMNTLKKQLGSNRRLI